MHIKQILYLIDNIAKSENESLYICGGVARDKFMNNLTNIDDVDLTTGTNKTSLIFNKSFEALSRTSNIKKRVSKDGHGTILFRNLKIDFSSNFINSELQNLNISSLQKEMLSRDFTCNALLLSPDLKDIQDPTKMGMDDIKNKIIKTPLNPAITLPGAKIESLKGIRIIRAIYLACKLGFDIDQKIIDWTIKNGYIVKDLNHLIISDKLHKAFKFDQDKAKFYINKMNLGSFLPRQYE